MKDHDSRRWQNKPHLRVSIEYLDRIFNYLADHRIRMYRMSSDLAPYITHPDLPQFHHQIDESREALASGLRQFLAAWPTSARLHAAPALASAAPLGRLLPLPRGFPPVPLHLPGATTPAAAALLAQAIGAPCQLLLSRSDARAVDSVGAFTARFLARDARVALTDGELRVTFADLDLALRKSGLDRDPGWLTWLERTARFEFSGEEL